MIREELRKVDRIARVHPESEKAEEWQEKKQHPIALWEEAGHRHDQGGADVIKDEGLFPPESRGNGTEKDQADPATQSLDNAIGEFRLFDRDLLGHAIGEHALVREILSRHDESPEGAQPHRGEAHRKKGVPRPRSGSEEFPQAPAILRRLGFGLLPLFRLFHGEADPDDEKGREHAEEVGVAPL